MRAKQRGRLPLPHEAVDQEGGQHEEEDPEYDPHRYPRDVVGRQVRAGDRARRARGAWRRWRLHALRVHGVRGCARGQDVCHARREAAACLGGVRACAGRDSGRGGGAAGERRVLGVEVLV